jgi:hypothetical protein
MIIMKLDKKRLKSNHWNKYTGELLRDIAKNVTESNRFDQVIVIGGELPKGNIFDRGNRYELPRCKGMTGFISEVNERKRECEVTFKFGFKEWLPCDWVKLSTGNN